MYKRQALAGVPDRVLEQGRDILRQLETGQVQALHPATGAQQQIDMFKHAQDCPLADAFQGIEPDNLTPREALELLYKLKGIADEYPL